MKPFMVVYYSPNLFDFGFKESRDRGVYIGFTERRPTTSDYPEHLHGKHPVYFTESEEEAQSLAKMLTEKQPGTSWLVGKTTQFYQSKIEAVKNTVRNVTDKGMLP